ncbi:hypothetical protein DI09_93p30 [Mitosporidium daphniae]|uniref:Uncharacterized protein n=1 Tax=Mitosporidium daphniae TaxID=1485682 RepID=A0A098VLP2_9MICR|nr:uncharacterized protein DI09_93p30 [Mitosporidium daphniae]KGG50017.1 hypothetical protein DI09_93p30 [Mitosporidium daphniae]|eukprot:XP_013236453.1 uncharacterized protein DI09_93p30 [Mitosporidium daphniae]
MFYGFKDYLIGQCSFGKTPSETYSGDKQEKICDFVQLVLFGFCICLSSFLFHLIILPIRIVTGVFVILSRLLKKIFKKTPVLSCNAEFHDCVKFFVFCISCFFLGLVDLSKLYHFIRGQNIVKLYVIFNVCEIADKLCCSFGLDLLNAVVNSPPVNVFGFSRLISKMHQPHMSSEKNFKFITLLVISSVYCCIHTLVLIYQIIALNVAINSHSNALLTLLLSNQFVELKSSVFKKFEKENLFQLSCSEMVERMVIFMFCVMIGWRNVLQLTSDDRASFWQLVVLTFTPLLITYVSEIFVDWLKHCFITKFNAINPMVYDTYFSILCNDITPFSSISPLQNNVTSCVYLIVPCPFRMLIYLKLLP